MALLSSVGFIACQKEAATPLSSADGTLNVTPRVKAFVERARSAELSKSSGTLSLDSAEWYLEAGLNYSIAEAWISSQDTRRDTITIDVTGDSQGIELTELYSAYHQLSELVQSSVNESDEHLIACDVRIGEQLGEYYIEMFSLIGLSGEMKSPNSNFGPNAFYRAMWEMVYPNNCGCGSNNGGSGPCAPKQIQGRLNSALPALKVGEYWTNTMSILVIGAPFFWDCPVNCLDVCLSPTQLSALVQSGWNGFNAWQPTNRTKIKAEVYSNYQSCCTWAKHEAVFYYGVKQSGAGS